MRDWIDDEEGPDPDYGPDLSHPTPPTPRDPRREAEAKRWREKRDRDARTGSEFNSHMIHLFNQARRP